MIEKVIEYSVRNPLIVILLALGVAGWGVYAVLNTPVDAIPDLSENQVIVFADWPGRSPREVEDQVTYPLSVNLQGLAGVKAIRATSEFGFSMVNIIFEDDTDFYFARQRVLERLSIAGTFLPAGVNPYLAPDANALGQIFWYTVEGEGHDLGRLRAIQDWFVRYQLYSVPGVAEVASVGGMPIEYQIDIDPNKLRAYGVTLGELYTAVDKSNSAVGGRVLQKGRAEYLIRSVGWIESTEDIENVVVKAVDGVPVTVGQVAAVQLGPSQRRGVLEKNGSEAVGGVVLMRYGENPLEVTERVKEKIAELQPGLPDGVRIIPFYDRSRLIHGAIDTVRDAVTEEILVASAIILLVLWHVRSALIVCLTLPMAVLTAFILMRLFEIPSNVMSLSGIAISIGVLVDAAIVMVDNAMHRLHGEFGQRKVTGDTTDLVLPALTSVGRPIFFSLLIMIVSFIPVFALGGMEGRMFHPLAFTKTFALVGVSVLAVTLVPALIPKLIRGRVRGEEESWLVRRVVEIYRPTLWFLLDHPWPIVWLTAVIFILGSIPTGMAWLPPIVIALTLGWTLWTARRDRSRGHRIAGSLSVVVLLVIALVADQHMTRLGREFMPPLDEGTLLDMPVTVPRAGITQVTNDLKARDALLRSFPEVEGVVGKAGRAETPTDPAPLDMVETILNLRPREHWPKRDLKYDDALAQSTTVLAMFVGKGWIEADDEQRNGLLNDATMFAVEEFDETLRTAARTEMLAFESRLAPALTHAAVKETIRLLDESGKLARRPNDEETLAIAEGLAPEFGAALVESPGVATVTELAERISRELAAIGAVEPSTDLLVWRPGPLRQAWREAVETLGGDRTTFSTLLLDAVEEEHDERWRAFVDALNWRLFDQAVPLYTQLAAMQLRKAAVEQSLWKGPDDERELYAAMELLEEPFADDLLLWRRSQDDLLKELDSTVQVPGWGNIWTQPIINRVDMLATGVRTEIGVKVFGDDLEEIQQVANQIAAVLEKVPGAADVFPDQIIGEGYVEIDIEREKAARYGINVGDIQDVIETALGGKVITTTVEGRERFPVRIRYARDFRVDEESVKNLLVAAAAGTNREAAGTNREAAGRPEGEPVAGESTLPEPDAPTQVPLSTVADVRVVEGPSMIRSENGLLRAYVQLNVRDRDAVGFVEEARRAVAEQVDLPAGMYVEWSGQFEHQVRAKRTLTVIVPVVVLAIFVLLYVTYHDLSDTLSVLLLAVPGAVAGGVLFQYLMGFNFSVAVWVGFIACFGLATENGLVMLVYLREAVENKGGLAAMTLADIRQAVMDGAVHRTRPKLLTEVTTVVGLAPMLWASGTGAELMAPMAAPVLGGMLVSDEVIDLLLPVLFYGTRKRRWAKLHGRTGDVEPTPVEPQVAERTGSLERELVTTEA
ncbi:MAG: efflux RND transporter permease subunit [Planctomycetaceae bacterium]